LASVYAQAILALFLLRREFRRRLVFPADATTVPVASAAVSAEA